MYVLQKINNGGFMQSQQAEISYPNAIILDLDMTIFQLIVYEIIKRNISGDYHTETFLSTVNDKVISNLLKNNFSKKITYSHTKLYSDKREVIENSTILIFFKEILNDIFDIAADKKIPIFILTYGLHPPLIMEKIINDDNRYALEYKPCSYPKRIFFKKNKQKGMVYFFNRNHIKTKLFHNMQNELLLLTKQKKIQDLNEKILKPKAGFIGERVYLKENISTP
jgi:hypothetical protein